MNHPISMTAAVNLHNGKPVTTSLKVAEFFDKNHYDVLRDIRRLIEPHATSNFGRGMRCKSGLSTSFAARNFAGSKYHIEGGKRSLREAEMYELTFDGFVILVMGYSGPKAMAIKEAYINEFNRMQAELESIKTDALRKAHKQLEQRNADWPLIKREYLTTTGVSARIEKRYGFGRGKVSRNVRRMVEWGYMREQDVATYKRLHREFGMALRAVQARQLELKLDQPS